MEAQCIDTVLKPLGENNRLFPFKFSNFNDQQIIQTYNNKFNDN